MALKFLLDIDAKLGASAAVAKTLGALERTLLRLDPQLKVTRAAAYALGTALGIPLRVGLELTKVLARVAGFGVGTAMNFLSNAASTALGFASVQGIKAIASGLFDLTKEMISTASAAERTHRAFSLLFGAQLGPALETQIESFAKHTAVDDDVFKGIVGGLKQAGLPDIEKNWRGIAQTITDLAALDLGKGSQAEKIEGFGEAFINLAKRGEVSSRMLGALGISQKEFWSDLASKLGMGVEETKKAAAKGKVALSDINNEIGALLFSKTGKPVGTVGFAEGAGAEAAAGRVGRIKDELFKSLAGSPEMGKLGAGLDRIASAFDPDSPTGKKISEGLKSFLSTLGDGLKSIDVDKISTTLVQLFTSLPPLINATTKAIVGFLSVMGQLTPDAQFGEERKANKYMQALKTAHATGGAMPQNPEIGQKPGFLGRLAWYADHPVDMFTGGPWKENATAAGTGFDDKLAPAGKQAGKNFANWVEIGTREGLEVHSPSKVFQRLGEASRQGFENGLGASEPPSIPAPSRSVEGSAGTSWRGMQVTVPITVNYSGEGGEDAARELGDRLRDILPGQLQAALEAMRLEMGMA